MASKKNTNRSCLGRAFAFIAFRRDKSAVSRASTPAPSGVTAYSGSDIATIKYSNAGVPLWTNRYNGPGGGGDAPWAMAMDRNRDVIVTGQAHGGASGFDYVTLKFLSPPVIANASMSNGIYQLQLRRPNTLVIEASMNLAGWTPVFTNYTTTNLLFYSDASVGNFPLRFYRAARVP